MGMKLLGSQVFMFGEKTFPFWTELDMPSSIFTDLILLFSTQQIIHFC